MSIQKSLVSVFVTVHPHEVSVLIHSSASFFFIMSGYSVVIPLRDEFAVSLGFVNHLGIFVGSLVLAMVAVPISTVVFSLWKEKALTLIHRFFSLSLVIFFILWILSTPGSSSVNFKEMLSTNHTIQQKHKMAVDENHGSFYVAVRIAMFHWISLLNLISISSTWARVIDVMDTESGSRLFGFISAGATLGQLVGSLFATGLAWLSPYLFLFAALLLEFAAQSSKGINKSIPLYPDELSSIRCANIDYIEESEEQSDSEKPQILEGLKLIFSSAYLLQIALFLWLSVVVSSFIYFQKAAVIGSVVADPVDRRRLFARINSLSAVLILGGQLTSTGCILSIAGVTTAICSAPFVAFTNLVALSIWPTWMTVAISETLRKVVVYVIARPGRELLFSVVTQDEKYKAKVCLDVIVQRLGDATGALMYSLLFRDSLDPVSLYALPVCVVWMGTGFVLGQRHAKLRHENEASRSG